ncbi:hypothetical protein [Microbacterium sp.]|uniref:hypothetical protein n=1 Tax=Microbacterium sp. TaxID=51671 RepID=UPI00263012FF|nr:hypothetical protein [Microbacterium sp.]
MPGRDSELTWAPPPLQECDEERWPIPLDEAYILSIRRVHWNGQLVAYAIVLTRMIGDRKLEIVCIDTMHHGSVHRHDGDHDAPHTVIRTISSQEDVQESFDEAYDEVYNAYLKIMGMDELR